MINEWLQLKHVYDQIDPEEQDECTGRSILRDTKDLINQIHNLTEPIINLAIQSPLTIQEVPEHILSKVQELEMRGYINAHNYELLPVYKVFFEIGTTGIANGDIICNIPNISRRISWFQAGKPTPKEWFERWGLTPPEETD